MSNLPSKRQLFSNSSKKDSAKLSQDESPILYSPINQASGSSVEQQIVVIVIPCGREDGKNLENELPYEIRLKKKSKDPGLSWV